MPSSSSRSQNFIHSPKSRVWGLWPADEWSASLWAPGPPGCPMLLPLLQRFQCRAAGSGVGDALWAVAMHPLAHNHQCPGLHPQKSWLGDQNCGSTLKQAMQRSL